MILIRSIVLVLICSGTLLSNSLIIIKDAETGKTPVSASVYFKALEGKDKGLSKKIILKENALYNPFDVKTQIAIKHISYETVIDTVSGKEKELEYLLEPGSIKLDEIVSTGQISPKSKQASVFNVNVIDNFKIQQQAAPSLKELLLNNMNTRIQGDAILGSGVSINGVSGQNVKIMIDGVPIVGRENGNINLEQLNLNDVEKVEIVEGPMSAVYGSDASAGVINLITKTKVKNGMDLTVNSYNESVGLYNQDATLNFRIDDWRFILNGGRYFFGGWSSADTSRADDWNPKVQGFGDLKIFKNWDQYELRINSRYYNEFILNRFDAIQPYGVVGFDDEYITDRILNSVNFKGEVSKDRFLDVLASYQFYGRERTKYIKDLTTLERQKTTQADDFSSALFHNLRLRSTYSFDNYSNNFSYQLGFDLNFDRGEGDRIFGLKSIDDYAVFLTAEYNLLDNFIIQPMFRAMYNTKFDAPLVSSVNMKYDFSDNSNFRFAVASGFRAPDLKELHLQFIDNNHDILGNEDLQAESSINVNGGFEYNETITGHFLKFQLKGFYNRINDMIELAQIGVDSETRLQEFTYVNINQFESSGVQFNGEYIRDNLNLNLGFSYNGQRNSIDSSTSNYFWSPELLSSISYLNKSTDTRLNVFYKFNGRFPFFQFDDSPAQQSVSRSIMDSFHNLDMNVSKTFFEDYTLTLGVKNALNVTFVGMSGAGGGGVHSGGGGGNPLNYGRTFFLRLNAKLF